jgi:hypothetical protein
MGVLYPLLAILFIGMAPSARAAIQDDLDALRRRLGEVEVEQAKSQATIEALRLEVEAKQAKSQATIEALRSEIAALGRATEYDRLAEQPVEEIRDVGTDAPADTDLPSVASARESERRTINPELARESRFVFKSDDGDFSLGIDGTLIGRYELNHRKDDGTGHSDTDQGFQTTGTRINFQGTLYDDFGYWARINADKFGDPSMDALLGLYNINDDAVVVVGQFPSVLNREQFIPADKLQVQESSPTNYTFDPFGYIGVMLAYHTPRMVYRGIVGDGYRSVNNSFFDEHSAKWAVAGQVSGLAVGGEDDWPRFDNFTSRRGSGEFAWLLSGAVHGQQGDGHDHTIPGSNDLVLGMVESSMEGNGWNLYGSGYYRYTNLRDIGGVNDFGFVLLGGVWVSKHLEMYSRFDMTIPDRDRPTEGHDFKTLTAGVNFYPLPHTDNIKIGTEALYMFDAEADSIVSPNIFDSVRASPDGGQWVFRTQAVMQW